MSLRPLLTHLADDPDGAALRARGRPRVRLGVLPPYVIGALLDGLDGPMAGRPALVVAADDRQARDLAADLRHWLAPRPVRFYPSRGVAYESHLAPPPHLVGLRVAALDALLSRARPTPTRAAGRRRLRRRAQREGPRPRAAPAVVLRCASATCSTSTRSPPTSSPPATSASTRSTTAASSPIRGGILDVFPATADHAVRVDLFDIEIESLREFSTFTQRSLGEPAELEIAPAAELAAEHREAAEIAALSDAEDRPDVAELLPVDRFHAFLDLAPADAAVDRRRGGRDRPGAAPTTGRTSAPPSTTSDAHDLYVKPDDVAGRARRARPRPAERDRRRPAVRVPRPGRRPRRALAARGRAAAREARPLRLPHGRHLAAARRGRAHRLQPGPR